MFVLTCVSGAGTKTGQLVVAPVRPPANTRASEKGVSVTSSDPWVQFCAIADGGRELSALLWPKAWQRLSPDSCVM